MGRFILGEITPKDLVVDSRQIDEILVALRKEGQMPKSSVVQLEQGLYEGTPAGREVAASAEGSDALGASQPVVPPRGQARLMEPRRNPATCTARDKVCPWPFQY